MTAGLLIPERVEARGAAGRRLPWTFGPVTLRLLLLGVLLLAPVWIDRRALWAVAAWDVIVLAAWFVDLRRLPQPEAIAVARSWDTPATLAAPQRVQLDVTNGGSVPLQIWVTDFAAPVLRPVPVELPIAAGPGATIRCSYEILPGARGDAQMNLVAVRYRSALGFAERWASVALPQTVRVYPDIADAQKHALALIRARQIVMEKRRSRVHGLGRDFESLREFQQGDELRDICWTATARRGRLVTRTYQPERSQTVWIVVDAGRLMRAREGRHTSLDRAVNAAFALAQVASGAGDRVALLVYGRRTQQRVPPGRGAGHLRATLEALAQARTEPAEADHTRAAAALMSMQKRRALVVWFTDVAESAGMPEVIDSAARLVPQHVLIFAVTRPPALNALAASVPSEARDLYRVMAAQEMVERRALLLRHVRQRGGLAIEVPSAELAAAVVDHYLNVKERNLL
jgi:uncharacterized protein (DUF58 family)